MDSIDCKIVEILKDNGRISNKNLSEMIGLNPSSTLERVKKLEERGIITGYSANLNYNKMGYTTTAIIQIALERHNREIINKFIKHISSLKEVTELYHISGQYDYMLKIYVEDNKELQHFLIENLTSFEYISKTETLLIFEEKRIR
jgi:Lrp/AsnC family leucine-responsive transcriptional regulator